MSELLISQHKQDFFDPLTDQQHWRAPQDKKFAIAHSLSIFCLNRKRSAGELLTTDRWAT